LSAKRFLRKFFKVFGICLGSLLILATAFHFWFVHHAEQILEDLVYTKSNGKIRLEVRNFKFNWMSRKMELEDAVFYTTDTTANSSYRFSVKKMKVKVKSIFPMVFKKQVLINTLSLEEPDIVVTRIRSSAKDTTSTKPKEDISIPREMGRIYHSIQDALQVLQVKKFEMENAKFALINNVRPDDMPVKITHFDFHIDNLSVGQGELTGKEKLFFSDNIVLKSKDQDILFPDGRHRLSYGKFRINIEKKIVEFDSCTIAAVKTDSSSTGFSIFFDKLQMTNIDFDTLYRAEVIKADSVYCINPQFKLQVDMSKRTGKTKPPKLDQVIRQLTGDLMLNFVVVSNASFDINTLRDGKPSSFTSNGNNFEMQGLRVDNNAKRPLKVEKFAMAIRNYENFLRDSLYALQFDSILVNNDKIYLNNFSFQQRLRGKTVNSFKVPKFQLSGLSWDDLLLENRLRARQAVLFHPTINYTEAAKKTSAKKNRSVYDILANMNEVIMLDDLSIINGDININLAGDISMKLQNATLAVESRSLLGSDQLSEIRRSVNHLDFRKGIFKIRDLTVMLDGISYSGVDSRLHAADVKVFNQSKTINAVAGNVIMDDVFVNEKTGDVSIEGISWEKADIRLDNVIPSGSGKKAFISLTDITGKNTQLNAAFGQRNLSIYFDKIGLIALLMKPGEKPIVSGLDITGKNLAYSDSTSKLTIARLLCRDQQKAAFENMVYQQQSPGDTIDAQLPFLNFVPDIQALIGGSILVGDMKISKPVISIRTTAKESGTKAWRLPTGAINKLVLEQPQIHYIRYGGQGLSKLIWNGQDDPTNSLVLLDLSTADSSIAAKQLYLSLRDFTLVNAKGRSFDAGKGEISALINDLRFQKQDEIATTWQGKVAMLDGKNFVLDSVGKKAGRLEIRSLQLKDLAINSASMINTSKLIQENTSFRVQHVTGSYVDAVKHLYWYNGGYDKGQKMLSVDSFHFKPALDREAYAKSKAYQTDHIQIKTGNISIGPFDIDKYLRDSVVSIGVMKVDNVLFEDYRDNSLPFKSGIIKMLTVNKIKSIPFKISADSVLFTNSKVTYTEVNAKTKREGNITVDRMFLRAFPVRNYGLNDTDSLRLQANGYLLDSAWVRIRLRESYTDSLSGFLLTLRMKPTDMRVLNPALEPLAGLRFRTGFLDTMNMRVHGNDYMAYGDMQMLYHDLRVQIILTEDPKKKRLLTNLLNFLANTFVVKNKNTNRTGKVFFVRDRERSSINYLVKMVLSGVNSNIGVRKTRKLVRQYKKELRQRNLPPFDYD
jgi:hypothetical protein